MDYAKEYGRLHENPKWFQGYSIKAWAPRIAELVAKHKPTSLLDYGCGKGHQYLEARVHETWGGLLPHCYDIGVRGLSRKPDGPFDGVICTDMLEHIAPADVPGVLDDIFASVRRGGFAFLGISCRPSHSGKKTLSNGSDVHLTVRPPQWWEAEIKKAKARRAMPIAVATGFEGGDAD